MPEQSSFILLDIWWFLEISPLALNTQSVQNRQKKQRIPQETKKSKQNRGKLKNARTKTKENWQKVGKKLQTKLNKSHF